MDQLAALGISDVEAFWKDQYPKSFGDALRPVRHLISVDPANPPDTFEYGECADAQSVVSNAQYCRDEDDIAWDRSESTGLLPLAQKYFGPMAVVGALAHEYGHAIQFRVGISRGTQTLVKEQQADCYWRVPDTESTRF